MDLLLGCKSFPRNRLHELEYYKKYYETCCEEIENKCAISEGTYSSFLKSLRGKQFFRDRFYQTAEPKCKAVVDNLEPDKHAMLNAVRHWFSDCGAGSGECNYC